MQRIVLVGIVFVCFGGALVLSQRVLTPEETSRAAAVKLFESLKKGRQMQMAAKEWGDKDRSVIRFATEGTGVPINKLSAEQRTLVDDLFRSMLSEYGLKRCQEMGGTGRVTFLGA